MDLFRGIIWGVALGVLAILVAWLAVTLTAPSVVAADYPVFGIAW
jgi:hypothetical protein